MSDTTRMASIAALLGDPARANILAALMDGRALTAKELAFAARVSPQTTSGHLARLTEAGLLAAEKQGRHRFFRLASPLVAQMLESVMAVAGPEPARPRHVARRRGFADGAHLLRSSGRPVGCGAGRLADSVRARDAGQRRRRGDRIGSRVPARFRRGPGGGETRLLPPLPGLERTPPAHSRAAGSGAGGPVSGIGTDRAP